MERVGQLLLSAHAVNNPQNNNPQNNTNTTTDNLDQVRPLVLPNPMELLSANILDYRDSKNINGFKVYRYACRQRAQTQGLNLSSATISLMASILWASEQQTGVQNLYINIARQAAHIYEFHHSQFPTNEHECEGCVSSIEIGHENLQQH